jgi:subtilisin family serine protease
LVGPARGRPQRGVDARRELGGGTAASSGTSYGAPHVAGTAGLYLSTHSTATPAVVENQLKADAVFTLTLSKDLTPVRLVYAGTY